MPDTPGCVRLTEVLGTAVPIIGAPMAYASGGELAAATAKAGAIGFIGAGDCLPCYLSP